MAVVAVATSIMLVPYMRRIFMGTFFIFSWRLARLSLILLSLAGFSIFLGFSLPHAMIGDNGSKEWMSTELGIVTASVGGIIATLFVEKLGVSMDWETRCFLHSSFPLPPR